VAVPEIVGSDVFFGAVPPPLGGEDDPEATTAVGEEFAIAEAAVFVAVTLTRTVEPASPEASVYVAAFAPAIDAQFAPAESHLLQPYVKVIGVVPFQLPVDAVRTCPTVGVPEIVGADEIDGPVLPLATVTTTAELALELPFCVYAVALSSWLPLLNVVESRPLPPNVHGECVAV
jgi:hypothetical protein